MTERKRFLLRLDPRLYATLEKWAADDLRSVNSQIEFLLGEAAKRSGRLPKRQVDPRESPGAGSGADDQRPGG